MIRTVRWLLIAGIVVCLGGIVRTSLRDGRAAGEHRRIIAAELEKIESYADEKLALEDSIKAVGERVEAMSEAERAGAMGIVMRRAREIAKRQEQLDGLELRSMKRITSRREKLSAVVNHMTRWDIGFGAGALVLAGLWFALGRVSARRRAP